MAAGLGFKTFTTGEVLTAGDTNGYLMQGVLVFANAAARTSAITSPQEGQMSYLKDTNSTEYYSGSAWTAVAGASGSMTLLSTTTLSGASTTISTINQSYKNLYFEVFGLTSTISNGTYKVTFGSTYGMAAYNSSSSWTQNNSPIDLGIGAEPLRTSANNFWQGIIYNYASTSTWKGYTISGAYTDTTSVARGSFIAGGSADNTAIDSLTFTRAGSGQYSTGTVKIYGVN